jgi:dienelactone hydrolase
VGKGPGALSFRNPKFKSLVACRRRALAKARELIAAPELPWRPKVRVERRFEFDGLAMEALSWQLPYGPRTEALFMKPVGAVRRLPAVLALHDHGGNKYFGVRKITRTPEQHPLMREHQEHYYSGRAWANELARRGYAVLVHDTFPFASRRVRTEDCSPPVRSQGGDPRPDDAGSIARYNAFAAAHEHIMEKSLVCAGTTWPGVYVPEDQRALDVLCARPDVDPSRVGCGGLSGGGMRTVFLGGLDDRIRCAVVVGLMTTWRDCLLDKCFTHTWMMFVPLLPRDLDFPEILALRAPAATMVLNCSGDPLFSLSEMKRADAMTAETFRRAGAPDRYRGVFYPGGHKFDLEMQKEAFEWFDRHLKPSR